MANDTPPDRDAPDESGRTASRAIARRDLEQVIRRAAELSLNETDTDENLTEAEVLRIGSELGLSAHHVKQALFELPELEVRPRWYDGWYGPAVLSLNRVVPLHKDAALRRIENYLATREYLQLVRRKGDNMSFVPADDTISSVARAFSRPGSRYVLARASRVMVGAHGRTDNDAHIHIDVDLSEARGKALAGGIGGGAAVGVLASAAAFIGIALVPGLSETVGILPQVVGYGAAIVGSTMAGVRIAASGFRERVHKANVETASLLDRLERDEPLDPPAPPWRRSLQWGRFLGG